MWFLHMSKKSIMRPTSVSYGIFSCPGFSKRPLKGRETVNLRYQAVPRPPPRQKLRRNETFTGGRLPIDAHRIFWDAETTKCWSCEMHQRMRNILLRCQWNDMKEFLHSWLNETMNQWIDKEMSINMPKNRWIRNEAMNQWIRRWINQSKNQGISESIKQRSNEPMNHRISD